MLLSAMLFVLKGLPKQAPSRLLNQLIRCCNGRLVSWCRSRFEYGRQAPGRACRGVNLGIFDRRTFPGKILCHAVQLNAPPDALVHEKMQSLAYTANHRGAGILHNLENGSGAV